jgi:hydroxyethylthiazole kinase
MLISPPFLPPRAGTDETDSQWLDYAMRSAAGGGSYPLGSNLCWHGGVHLEAPMAEENQRLPVVAIADGTIVDFRQPTPEQLSNSEHVLKFDDGKWTSDGALVLKHETEIGALDTAPVKVTFYSVYQHLSEISATVIQRGKNGRLYRKEEIGRAGYIAGVPHLIHFEIVCDDANLEKLIGRTTGALDTGKNGREDVVFGEIYFKIPKGTLIYEVPNNRRMRDKIDNNAPQTVDATAAEALGTSQAIPPMQIKKTEKDCFIGLRYASGEGFAAERGDLKAVTYIEDEARPGEYLEYGMVTRQEVNASFAGLTKNTFGYNEAEYALYYRVKEICKEWGSSPPNSKPMPSAVLELLKFGRVINTAHHPNPAVLGQMVGDIAATPNWRKIVVPAVSASWQNQNQNAAQTCAWINLNSPDIKVFSDADFPHWRGWRICDDDPSIGDSRCDSPSVRDVLERAVAAQFPDAQGLSSFDLKKQAVASGAAAEWLVRSVCTMPSEWGAATAAERWSWLKESSAENGDPMTEAAFSKLTAFVQALSINAPELDTATRHFNPRAFIEAFRKCLWFSAEEFAQCIPRKNQRRNNSGIMLNGTTSIPWPTALTRSQMHYMPLNRFFQKFCGHSRHRVIHNIAQMLIETDRYQMLREYGSGNATSGNARFYTVFYGRGYHQVTWPSNYMIYGEWRNVPNTVSYFDPRITQTSVHYKDMPKLHEPTFPQKYPQCVPQYGGQPHPQAGQPDPQGQVSPMLRPAWCAPSFQWSPRFDPVIVERDHYEAAESSGAFWFSKSFAGRKNLNRVCDLQNPDNVHNVAYVSWLVNGGDNGHAERQEFARFLANILLDAPYRTGAQQFQILRALTAGMVNGNPTFPPNSNAQTNNTMIAKVHYEFQRRP